VARGGLAIVQEPTTAESPEMPTAALKAVPTARVMTVGSIGVRIGELARARTPDSRGERSTAADARGEAK
jgi:chemotaxis response regulator CheB